MGSRHDEMLVDEGTTTPKFRTLGSIQVNGLIDNDDIESM